jgi:hypothetical protein
MFVFGIQYNTALVSIGADSYGFTVVAARRTIYIEGIFNSSAPNAGHAAFERLEHSAASADADHRFMAAFLRQKRLAVLVLSAPQLLRTHPFWKHTNEPSISPALRLVGST